MFFLSISGCTHSRFKQPKSECESLHFLSVLPFIEKPIESYTLRFTPSACRSSASKGGSLHVVPQQQRMTELQVWHTRLYCSDARWFTTYRVLDGSLRTGFENDKLPPVFKSGSHF
jgi:hypothetical protein